MKRQFWAIVFGIMLIACSIGCGFALRFAENTHGHYEEVGHYENIDGSIAWITDGQVWLDDGEGAFW